MLSAFADVSLPKGSCLGLGVTRSFGVWLVGSSGWFALVGLFWLVGGFLGLIYGLVLLKRLFFLGLRPFRDYFCFFGGFSRKIQV